MEWTIWCESHLVNGERVPATTHSTNPNWSGYDLCEECAREYDNRLPVDDRGTDEDDDGDRDGVNSIPGFGQIIM